MPSSNLTPTRIEKLTAPGWYSMAGQPSFGVRVSKGGGRSYYWQGRVNGKQVWKRIAAVGDVKLDVARTLAMKLGEQRASGSFTPEQVLPAAPAGPYPLRLAWAFYWKEHLSRKASGPDAASKVTRFAADLLERDINDLDAEDVEHWFEGLETHKSRRHVLQSLKAACNRAAKFPKRSGWPKGRANPLAGIAVPKSGVKTRKLVGDDLMRFVAAAMAHDDPAVRAFVVGLVVTGARLSELRLSTIQEYDRARRRLNLAGGRMKNGQAGTLTLGPVSAKLLEQVIDKRTSGFIFEGASRDGSRDFRKPWAAICKAAGVEVTFHDMRRTAAAVLDAARFDGLRIEMFLNHAVGNVQAAYRTMDPLDPMRDDMAAEIERACGLSRSRKPRARRSS